MTLGRQFDRTYHIADSGSLVFYHPVGQYDNYDPDHKVRATTGSIRDQSYQGMLFSPHVGTGEGGDPAVFTRERAERALGTSVDRLTTHRRNPHTPEQAEADVSTLTRQLARTSMPPHVMDALAATGVTTNISASSGRSSYGNGIVTITNGGRGEPDVGALVHELGHAIDPHVDEDLSQRREPWLKKDKGQHSATGRQMWVLQDNRPDPRSEGVADGFSDRFERLTSSQETPEDVARLHDRGTYIGSYGTGFSGFKDKASKAAYSAVRAHAAAGDLNAAEGIPSRTDLLIKAGMGPDPSFRDQSVNVLEKSGRSSRTYADYLTKDSHWRNEMIDTSIGNSMLVGYLAHEHPHVQPVLEAGGFGKEMQKGLSLYREKFPPVPHAVELSMGERGALARSNHAKMRHARALDRWLDATEADLPHTQTETLF